MVSVVPSSDNVAELAVALAEVLERDGHMVIGREWPKPYLKPHDTRDLFMFAVRLGSQSMAGKVREKIRKVWPSAEIETAITKTCLA